MAKLYVKFFTGFLSIALALVLTIGLSPIAQAKAPSIYPYNTGLLQSSNELYGYKIIPATKSTWGYEITKNKKTIIKQLNIPAIPGTLGFKTKEDATKVAKLVVSKLKLKEDLPTISIQELQDLKVIPQKNKS